MKSGFIEKLLPIARKYASQLSQPMPVLIAQAALETGWGQHFPGGRKGSSHNLFGIKAGFGWLGARTRALTREYRGTEAAPEVAEFRAYGSVEESFADYVDLIRGSARYRQARAATDPAAYLRSLQSAGYATDPGYADKVLAILHDPEFQTRIGQFKNMPDRPSIKESIMTGSQYAR